MFRMDNYFNNKLRLAKNSHQQMSCSLTDVALRERKTLLLDIVQQKILEKIELESGYAYRFESSDKMLGQLLELIRAERTCCSFFIFTLSVSSPKDDLWLNITGAEGVKNFIIRELGF